MARAGIALFLATSEAPQESDRGVDDARAGAFRVATGYLVVGLEFVLIREPLTPEGRSAAIPTPTASLGMRTRASSSTNTTWSISRSSTCPSTSTIARVPDSSTPPRCRRAATVPEDTTGVDPPSGEGADYRHLSFLPRFPALLRRPGTHG